MFVSGMPVSVSDRRAPVRPPTAQAPAIIVQGTPLGLEDAVRMALENNLGIQVEKLNPQIQLLGCRGARRGLRADAVLDVLAPQQRPLPRRTSSRPAAPQS